MMFISLQLVNVDRVDNEQADLFLRLFPFTKSDKTFDIGTRSRAI